MDLSKLNLTIAHFFKDSNSVRSQIFLIKKDLQNLLEDSSLFEVKKVLIDEENLIVRMVILKKIFNSPVEFVIIEDPGKFFILLSTHKGDIWNKIISNILENFGREVGYSFLNSLEIKKILQSYEQKTRSKIFFRRSVAKGVFGKKLDFTEVHYEKVPKTYFLDAFKKAETKKGWIRMIEVYNENNTSKFLINYKGQITVMRGGISLLLDYILKEELKIIINKHKFYSNRDRKSTQNHPQAILIEFNQDVFNEKAKILQFLNKIEKYPKCHYTIVEAGNPLLYMKILDRNDMSSFSIRTKGSNGLLLIPKIKTSAFALERFSRYLIENFMEGETNDYQERY